MDDLSSRLAALTPKQRALLEARLKAEGIDLGIGFPPLQPAEEREYYPLSPVQRRLFFIHQFEEAGIVYNVVETKVIPAGLDKERLKEVLKILIHRHESFRTSFEYVAGEPVQRVHRDGALEIECDHMAASEAKGREIEDFVRPFDLSRPPLLRVGTVELAADRFLLMLDMHHIMSDQASRRIVINEFLRLYIEGKSDLPALKFRYKDFALWRRSTAVAAALKSQQAYWLKEFAGEIPVLNLPTDFERPRPRRYEGGSLSFRIDQRQTLLLKELAVREHTTLFVVLLAIYNVFLSKISRQADIIVGTPVSGRRHAGLDAIIGMFVNTLVLRNRPGKELTFRDFLEGVKQKTLRAFENQDYEFEELVNGVVRTRDSSRNPLFDVFFSFTYPDFKQLPPIVLDEEQEISEARLSMFDLFLTGAEIGEGLYLLMIYSTALFNHQTIQRFAHHFRQILSTAAQHPETRLKDIHLSHDLETAAPEVFADEANPSFDF
jgi:fengycin family lipopeptide synthetase D